jgi:hypothetical protein
MKQNTVLAAVSIGLFLALVFTNIGGDENEQNSSNTKRIQDSPPVIVEDTRYSVDPQSNSGSPTEMAMEQEEWWDNTASSTDRLTEEEMVEMLESLWGPSDLPSPDNNEDVLNAEDIEDEEDFFNTEEPDIMLQDEPKTTNDSNFGRSLTASILTLDVDTDNVDRNTNKAQAITRGGDDTPEVNIPDNSKNLTADDFSPPKVQKSNKSLQKRSLLHQNRLSLKQLKNPDPPFQKRPKFRTLDIEMDSILLSVSILKMENRIRFPLLFR